MNFGRLDFYGDIFLFALWYKKYNIVNYILNQKEYDLKHYYESFGDNYADMKINAIDFIAMYGNEQILNNAALKYN